MNYKNKRWIVFFAALSLLLSGCKKEPAADPHAGHDHAPGEHGKSSKDTHADDERYAESEWCAEHDVPEAECTRCNPALVQRFKDSGDWCDGHSLPESQCLLCNPTFKAKFDAMRPVDPHAGHNHAPGEHGKPGEDAHADDELESARTSGMIVERWQNPLHKRNEATCQTESIQIRFDDSSIVTKAGIVTKPVERRRMSAEINCPAEVGYNKTRLAHITPRVQGVIAKVEVDLGAAVHAGDLLAVIESPELGQVKSRYIKARETHLIAVADMDRHRTVHNVVKEMLKSCDQHATSDQLRKAFVDARIGEAKSRLLNAHADLELERQRFERESTLAKQGISSVETRQTAQSNLTKAEASFAATHEAIDIAMEKEHLDLEKAVTIARVALDAARRGLLISGMSKAQVEALDGGEDQTLDRYELRSPIDGTVVNLHAVVGESATTETAVFSVADLSSMWLMLSLQERDLVAVNRGQLAHFTVDGLRGRRFAGKIDWISSEIDRRTRTVQARVSLANVGGVLRANMFGTAKVIVRDDDAVLAVPVDALQTDGCCNLVFVNESDTLFRASKVTLGVEVDGYIEVLSGLSEQDRIATVGGFLLKTEILKGSIGAGCCEVDPGR